MLARLSALVDVTHAKEEGNYVQFILFIYYLFIFIYLFVYFFVFVTAC